MKQITKSEMSLDDFLSDAAKVVNPIQANPGVDYEELQSYTKEEIKVLDAERDRNIALVEADKIEADRKLKPGIPVVEQPVDPELLAQINEIIGDYHEEEELEGVKLRMFCYFADFQKPLLEPLLKRQGKFLSEMEDVSPYQIARDSKVVDLLENILRELKRL